VVHLARSAPGSISDKVIVAIRPPEPGY